MPLLGTTLLFYYDSAYIGGPTLPAPQKGCHIKHSPAYAEECWWYEAAAAPYIQATDLIFLNVPQSEPG